MNRYIFDCETDGLLDELTKVHSLVLKNIDTGEVISCSNDFSSANANIPRGLRLLEDAELIIAHNGIEFDIPALQKVYPRWKPKGTVRDTLVLSRLIWTNLSDIDGPLVRKGRLPNALWASHSLKAWGHRLGNFKGDFEGPWDAWTPEMQSYCEQDVEVTHSFWRLIESKNYSQRAVELEHEVAWIAAAMTREGFPFDEVAAASLYAELVQIRADMAQQVLEVFKPWWVAEGDPEAPKAPRRRWVEDERGAEERRVKKPKEPAVIQRGYWAHWDPEAPYTPVRLTEFNPSSRQHIADRLKVLYGWEPEEFTKTGQAKVDETVLSRLPWPEAKVLAKYFTVEKRIGQLAEGDNAWLKLVKQGKIHGSYVTNGAVTGRATHNRPNIAQVPSVKHGPDKKVLLGEAGGWGAECRDLFRVPEGWTLVGADQSGLELRCLSHYMARYDNGAYVKVVTEGDVHTTNQKAFGFHLRSSAKTGIYALIYGCMDPKLGAIQEDDCREAKKPLPQGPQRARGRAIRARLMSSLPALAYVQDAVEDRIFGWSPGTARKVRLKKIKAPEKPSSLKPLTGLDGRSLHIRSAHAAVNTLLQSAGALICKLWMVLVFKELQAQGLKHGWDGDFVFCAWVHDELQIAVKQGLEDFVGNIAVRMAAKAGEEFQFRCPTTGEFKKGRSWRFTH